MQNNQRTPFLILLTGILGGICISLLIGIGLFYARLVPPSQPPIVVDVQPTAVILAPTAAATPDPVDPLDQAELALNSGHPEQVRDLLYPMIERWTVNKDLIRGYRLLGEAELIQGHPQLAVPYFEKLYFYEPTAENLFLLATVYDAGGNNRSALARYQELIKWEDLPDDVDIELVKMRVYHLSRALGTPLPTLTFLP